MTGNTLDLPRLDTLTDPDMTPGRIYRRDELATIPPPAPIIHGLLATGPFVLAGFYGLGKSFLTLSWACSVATGQSWLGHDTEPAPILYVVGEGAAGLDTRIAGWEHAYNGGRPVGGDMLTVVTMPDTLTNADTWTKLGTLACQRGARLVVLDTFSSLAPDAHETNDAAVIMRRLAELADVCGGAAGLVHHTGWGDQGRVRGGSQIESNTDQVFILSKVDDDGVIRLESKKQKETASGGAILLRRRPYTLHDGRTTVVLETARPSEIATPWRDRVLDVLADQVEGQTARQILLMLGGDETQKRQVNRALIDAWESGLVAREDRARNGRWWLPDQVPNGVDLASSVPNCVPNGGSGQ